MPPKKNGCAFGKVTRERVDNFIKMFEDFRDNEFAHLAEDVKNLGKRPTWLVSIIITALTGLLTALAIMQIAGK